MKSDRIFTVYSFVNKVWSLLLNMYDAIDEYLDQYDGQHAYDLIKEMISDDEAPNAELAYRFAHACYILSNSRLSKEGERYRLLKEGEY
ncbi:unnamed protein product [Onchocerca flexuosa]|uniref:Imm63 domain-containing protein n=1 Tax=Onchocerca flexuosa TaxID=387005 RepID=A0A183GYE3_9BILA|nr:unnamed protein product [Onchocerca flexuosa]